MSLLTEDEARRETCPFIRYCVNEDAVQQDGRAAIYIHQNCMASECRMAWRWAETPEFKSRAEAEFRKSGRRLKTEVGYCGIAGAPTP